ncbi:MAG TPA: hypothetical protein VGP68_03365 [Gemmataceae bacterium]|nr:hypothetical protein [Gemmataceae bacterium]
MRACLMKVVAVGILLAGSSWARAQDDAKAILDKAVKAHGGAEKLGKVKAQQTKAKGSVETPMGLLEFNQESTIQHPDKIKEIVHVNINGMQISITTIYNGKEGWINVAGQTMALEGDMLEAIKDTIDTLALARLAFLGGKDYQVTSLGESKVGDRPVLGVKVARKGHKDVNMYFDKETNLLAKLEHRVKDPMGGQEMNEERIILEYQDVDGMKAGKKVVVNRDGKKYMEAEVTEVKFLDKVDDSNFEKP